MSLYENKVVLKGFLGRDAETKTTTKGRTFVFFSVATKSGYKSKETDQWVDDTEWHRVVAFGRISEMAVGLKRGDYVESEGEMRSAAFDPNTIDGKPIFLKRWEVRATVIRKLEAPTKFSPDVSAA